MKVQVWYDVNRGSSSGFATVEETEVVYCRTMTFDETGIRFFDRPPHGGKDVIKEFFKKYNRFRVLNY